MIIDSIKRNSALQDKLLQQVIDSKSTIVNSQRQVLEQRWARYYDLYRGLRTKGTYSGRADLDWASAFIAVEILVPRIFNALFPRSKWFALEGVENSDRKQAKIMQKYLENELEKNIKFRQKMVPYLRYMAIHGTLVCKTPFRHETETIPTRKRIITSDNIESFEVTDNKVVTFDSIDLQLVDLFDFFPADDTITDINDQPFVIHQAVKTMQRLKKNAYDEDENPTGAYENLDKIQWEKDRPDQDYGSQQSYQENAWVIRRRQELGIGPRVYAHLGRPVDIDEYQGLIDINGKEELYIVTVANRNTVIQAEPLNTPDAKKTYVKGTWIDMPNEFFGMSSIERVERPIFELNDRVNQTMDVTSHIINPIYLNTDAYLKEGKLRVFPSRIIKTVTKDGLTPLRPPTEVLTPAYQAIQTLVSLIQDTTGATRFLGGSAQTPELQRTATGIMSIIKEANARLNLIVQSNEDTFVKEFLRKAYKYSQFYATRERVIRITGKHGIEYQTINPQEIVGDYDFKPLGSQSIGTEEIMNQQMINFLNIIAKMPQIAAQGDMMWLVQRIAEQMLGMEDAEEFLGTSKRQEEEIEKAQSENNGLLKGIPGVVDPFENHRLHIQIHTGILQDPRFQQAGVTEEIFGMIRQHISKHEFYEATQGLIPETQPGQSDQQGQPGVPAQEQPRAGLQNLVNQVSQPSQLGTL